MRSEPHILKYLLPAPNVVGDAVDQKFYLGPMMEVAEALPGELLEQVTKTQTVPGGTEVTITRYVWRE